MIASKQVITKLRGLRFLAVGRMVHKSLAETHVPAEGSPETGRHGLGKYPRAVLPVEILADAGTCREIDKIKLGATFLGCVPCPLQDRAGDFHGGHLRPAITEGADDVDA